MNKSNMSMKPTDILHILHDSYFQGIKIFLREILQRVHNVSRDVTAYILTSPSKCVSELIFELFQSKFICADICAQNFRQTIMQSCT